MTRKLWLAGLVGLVGVALLSSQAPSDAQGKKDELTKMIQKLQAQLKEKDQTINNLQNQIQKLKLEGTKDDGKIALLQQKIKQLEADLKGKKDGKGDKSAAQLKKDLEAAQQTIKERDQTIKTLEQKAPKAVADLNRENQQLRSLLREAESVKKAPFVHTIILKSKKEDEKQILIVTEEAQKTLGMINGVRGLWIGKRAEKGTPELAQTGYQLGIVVLLDDADALTKFLDDPLHKQFNDKLGSAWERPVVYDILRDKQP